MKISLVIPTKNRIETLKYCVESCLATRYENCEVIVSNNQSDDDTAQYLAQLSDPRLKVLTTPAPFSMRANFEFALQHATGDYITYIGDDDGITNFGLEALAFFVRNSGADAINWAPLPYIWPDTVHEGALSNLVLKMQNFSNSYHVIDADAVFREFTEGTIDTYMKGAKIYHGSVSRKLIDKVRSKSNGTYFGAMAPDVYVAIANLSYLEKFIGTTCAISISGKSAKSNAWTSKPTGDRKRAELFFDDSKLSTVPDPHSIVDRSIRSLRVHELDALMLLNEHHFDGNLAINFSNWLKVFANSLICVEQEEHNENIGKMQAFAEKLGVPCPEIPAFVKPNQVPKRQEKRKVKVRPKHLRSNSPQLKTVVDVADYISHDPEPMLKRNAISAALHWWAFQTKLASKL